MNSLINRFKNMYFIFSFTIAIFAGFTIPYLNGLGFSNTQVGFMMALLYFSGIIGQTITGYICDLKRTIKKVFFLWMILLSALVFFLFKISNPIWISIFLIMIGFFQSSVFALIDSWILESDATVNRNFGPIRAFGSIGWGISTLIFGKLIDNLGWGIVGFSYLFFTSIFFLISFNTKDAKHVVHDKHENSITINSLIALIKNKYYVFLIIIFFLLYSSFHVIGMFSVILIEEFGGTKAHIGLFLLIAAFSEVPMLLNAKKIMEKFDCTVLLIISSAFFFIRTFLTAFTSSVFLLISLSVLQMISFSILIFISKYLIDEVSPKHLKTSSQTIAIAFSSSLSGIISLNLSGYLADVIGIQKMMLVISSLCMIAFILSIKYHKQRKKI